MEVGQTKTIKIKGGQSYGIIVQDVVKDGTAYEEVGKAWAIPVKQFWISLGPSMVEVPKHQLTRRLGWCMELYRAPEGYVIMKTVAEWEAVQ